MHPATIRQLGAPKLPKRQAKPQPHVHGAGALFCAQGNPAPGIPWGIGAGFISGIELPKGGSN
jgi:hypothetical protein